MPLTCAFVFLKPMRNKSFSASLVQIVEVQEQSFIRKFNTITVTELYSFMSLIFYFYHLKGVGFS